MSRGICHFAGLRAKADGLRRVPPLSGLLGCCCREVEAYVEERVEQAMRREARVLRQELQARASCSEKRPVPMCARCSV